MAIWSIAVNPSSSSLAHSDVRTAEHILSIVNDTFNPLTSVQQSEVPHAEYCIGPPSPPKSKTKKDSDVNLQSSEDDHDEDKWNDSSPVMGCSDSSLQK